MGLLVLISTLRRKEHTCTIELASSLRFFEVLKVLSLWNYGLFQEVWRSDFEVCIARPAAERPGRSLKLDSDVRCMVPLLDCLT
jgi:hypothetical protein